MLSDYALNSLRNLLARMSRRLRAHIAGVVSLGQAPMESIRVRQRARTRSAPGSHDRQEKEQQLLTAEAPYKCLLDVHMPFAERSLNVILKN